MKPLGSDGRPIPTPPDARDDGEILADFWREKLQPLAWLLGAAGLHVLLGEPPFLGFAWASGVRVIAYGLGFLIVVFILFGLFDWMLRAALWPLRRQAIGRGMERRAARYSPEQIVEEIQAARRALEQAGNERQRRGGQRWLAWLEARSNIPPMERKALVPGVYRPTLSAWAMDVAGIAAVLAAGAWLDRLPQAHGAWVLAGGATLFLAWRLIGRFSERLELTADTLAYHSHGRERWSAPRAQIAADENGSGWASYTLYDMSTGALLGTVRGATFGGKVIEALADLFPPLIRRKEV